MYQAYDLPGVSFSIPSLVFLASCYERNPSPCSLRSMCSLNMHIAFCSIRCAVSGFWPFIFWSTQVLPGNIGVPRFQSSPFLPPLPGRPSGSKMTLWDTLSSLEGNGQGTLFLQGPMGDLIPKLPNCLGVGRCGGGRCTAGGSPFSYSRRPSDPRMGRNFSILPAASLGPWGPWGRRVSMHARTMSRT